MVDEDNYVDLETHFAMMVEATKLLNQISANAAAMRYQFGDAAPAFLGLVDAIDHAQ